ncbi:MAG TPA: hypothetical protein VFA68_19640 [Terriglobales bacterium]|nr:hypothetical protein [Terriglobales bacterium]
MPMKLTVSLALLLTVLLGYSISPKALAAQDTPTPTSPAPADTDNDNDHGRATSYKQFDHALRKDPQMAEELKKNPSLMNDPGYLEKHPGLKKYMDTHPDMAKAAKSNPERLLGSVHRAQVKQQRQTREHHPEHTKQQPK